MNNIHSISELSTYQFSTAKHSNYSSLIEELYPNTHNDNSDKCSTCFDSLSSGSLFIEVSQKLNEDIYISKKFDLGQLLSYIHTTLSVIANNIDQGYLTRTSADTLYVPLSGGTMYGPLVIDYNTETIDNTLKAATTNNGLVVKGELGNVSFNNALNTASLNVDRDAEIGGMTKISGDTTIGNSNNYGKNLTIYGALNLDSGSDTNEACSIEGNIKLHGQLTNKTNTLTASISVNSITGGNITASTKLTSSKSFSAAGTATFSGTPIFQNGATFNTNGTLTIERPVSCSGNSTFSGEATFSGPSLKIKTNATIETQTAGSTSNLTIKNGGALILDNGGKIQAGTSLNPPTIQYDLDKSAFKISNLNITNSFKTDTSSNNTLDGSTQINSLTIPSSGTLTCEASLANTKFDEITAHVIEVTEKDGGSAGTITAKIVTGTKEVTGEKIAPNGGTGDYHPEMTTTDGIKQSDGYAQLTAIAACWA